MNSGFDPEQYMARLEEIRQRAEAIGTPDGTTVLLHDAPAQQARWKKHVLDPLRRLGSIRHPLITEAVEVGLLPENTGTSVMTLRRWKEEIRDSGDRPYCLWLLRFINTRGLEFWTRYKLYENAEALVEAVDEGSEDYDSAVNVAKTAMWLEDQDVPDERPPRQKNITRWSS